MRQYFGLIDNQETYPIVSEVLIGKVSLFGGVETESDKAVQAHILQLVAYAVRRIHHFIRER